MIVRKIGVAIGTLFVVVTANFFLFRVVQTDPVAAVYRGRNLSEAKKAELEERFNLNGSKLDQYVGYLEQLSHGNLGYTLNSQPVSSEIAEKLPTTLKLVGTTTILTAVIGIWLGIRAGWRPRSKFDRITTGITMFFYSTSDAFFGLALLYLFASKNPWFPTGGLIDPNSTATGLNRILEQFHHLVLPGTVLVIGYLGQYSLVQRAAMLETSGEDYLTLARAKGLRDSLVRRRHAVPNALLPSITLIALNVGYTIGGAIIVETTFSIPGIGSELVRAAKGPDYALLQGIFLLISAAVIAATLIADLLYPRFDPRVRTP